MNNSFDLLSYLFLMSSLWNSYINTLLSSKIQLPIHAGLLSFNETLLFHVAINYFQIFCATYSLVLMYILNSLFHFLLALHRFCFSSSPLFFRIQHYSLICAALFYPFSISFCFYSFLCVEFNIWF